jgi:hypothetical protein
MTQRLTVVATVACVIPSLFFTCAIILIQAKHSRLRPTRGGTNSPTLYVVSSAIPFSAKKTPAQEPRQPFLECPLSKEGVHLSFQNPETGPGLASGGHRIM